VRSTRSDDKTLGKDGVHHILKGGEDSIGGLEAIQRVYFNIGSCAEACWVNHLTDFRQVDPQQRGFGQTSFRIGQCRRDCPNFRAIEDRLTNVLDFFLSAEADETDLHVARDRERKAKDSTARSYTRQDLIADLEKEFGPDAVRRGRQLFAENCARCHSSIPDSPADSFKTRDFYAVADDHPRKIRKDFLGNDASTPGDRSRHVPLPRAALEPPGGPPLRRIRVRDAARQAGGRRHPGAQGSEGQRPRVLPQHLAAQCLGDGAVHAQQCDRAGNLRQAEERGKRLLPQPLRRRVGQARRPATAMHGLRPERRWPPGALPALDVRPPASPRSAASSRRSPTRM
jgi:hypothetical protein